MASNNLAPAAEPANDSPDESPPRDHPVTISITAEEYARLEQMAPALKERLNRRTVPVATVAYEMFRRGLELERAA